jgi:hypothetical protein
MAKQNHGRSRNKPRNTPPPTSPPEGSDIHSQPKAQPKANDCRYVKQEPPNVYVNIPEAKEETWSYANKIGFGMFITTVVLTWFTYSLQDELYSLMVMHRWLQGIAYRVVIGWWTRTNEERCYLCYNKGRGGLSPDL